MNMEVEEKPIDFNALETELQAAIDADVKYWRENDVKIRAVEQRVASYEEFKYCQAFKDLVKAAHLKPLDKARKQNGQEDKKIRIWNSIASKRSESGKEYSELYLSNTKQNAGLYLRIR
ncbi:Coiled-coil domain-containing protein 103 [Blattella germanica]|nr:Coiled-coil domain-containing protein 103 [Blattella germanica]